jgi:hypothetical protein
MIRRPRSFALAVSSGFHSTSSTATRVFAPSSTHGARSAGSNGHVVGERSIPRPRRSTTLSGGPVTVPSIRPSRRTASYAVRRSRVDRIGSCVLSGAGGLGGSSSVELEARRLSREPCRRSLATAADYTRLMSMEYPVQRLEIEDVVLIDLDEQEGKVEAKVVRSIERTETTVRVTLVRVKLDEETGEEFVREWPLGAMVTVVRGP